MPSFADLWCGFYWTEGNRGLGWAVDAVPTLKGGSTIGIPSPPAIWDPLRARSRRLRSVTQNVCKGFLQTGQCLPSKFPA